MPEVPCADSDFCLHPCSLQLCIWLQPCVQVSRFATANAALATLLVSLLVSHLVGNYNIYFALLPMFAVLLLLLLLP